MPTQRDLETAAKVSLKRCDKCGWYDGYSHADRCNPTNGHVARQLIDSVTNVQASQLGYGDNCIGFDFSDNFSVILEIEENHSVLRHMHLLERLNTDEATKFIHVLNNWMQDMIRNREK